MTQVVLQLAGAQVVADVTDILAGTGLAAIGADGGAIALRDEDREVVHLTTTPSLGAGVQQRFATIPLDSRLPAAWAARTGETVVLQSQAEAEAWSTEMREAFEQSGQRAWIAVPLTAGEQLFGSLVAGWEADRTFSPDEVDAVQAFAAQCAQALDRVQALAQERRSAERSRRLAEELQRSMLTDSLPARSLPGRRPLPARDGHRPGRRGLVRRLPAPRWSRAPGHRGCGRPRLKCRRDHGTATQSAARHRCVQRREPLTRTGLPGHRDRPT